MMTLGVPIAHRLLQSYSVNSPKDHKINVLEILDNFLKITL